MENRGSQLHHENREFDSKTKIRSGLKKNGNIN
jgi:hypothetical protein